MIPVALWLIRHGESTWNAARRWQGQGDPPLSERGRKQARALAHELVDHRIERILASDLARAHETAAILGEALGLEPTLDPRLRERDIGVWAGRPGEEIAAHWADDVARLRAGDATLRPGGGETLAELRARVTKALDDLFPAPGAQRVALVTHLGVIRLLAHGADPGNAEVLHTTLADARRALLANRNRRLGAAVGLGG